jgi:hypothetical protein
MKILAPMPLKPNANIFTEALYFSCAKKIKIYVCLLGTYLLMGVPIPHGAY